MKTMIALPTLLNEALTGKPEVNNETLMAKRTDAPILIGSNIIFVNFFRRALIKPEFYMSKG